MEDEDDSDNLDEKSHNRPDGTLGTHTKKDTEDVKRKKGNDHPLDHAVDNLAKLEQNAFEDSTGNRSKAEPKDESEQESSHYPENGRHIDRKEGLQRSSSVGEGGGAGARVEDKGVDQKRRTVSKETGEEGGTVSDSNGEPEKTTSPEAQLGNTGSNKADDDQRNREAEKTTEQIVEGNENARQPSGKKEAANDTEADS